MTPKIQALPSQTKPIHHRTWRKKQKKNRELTIGQAQQTYPWACIFFLDSYHMRIWFTIYNPIYKMVIKKLGLLFLLLIIASSENIFNPIPHALLIVVFRFLIDPRWLIIFIKILEDLKEEAANMPSIQRHMLELEKVIWTLTINVFLILGHCQIPSIN